MLMALSGKPQRLFALMRASGNNNARQFNNVMSALIADGLVTRITTSQRRKNGSNSRTDRNYSLSTHPVMVVRSLYALTDKGKRIKEMHMSNELQS